MSHVLAGFSVNRQTEPAAGYRVDVLGAIRTESEVAGDATLFLTMVGFGANSATTSLMTGDRDPNGLVSALPGTLYLRSDGVNSNLYENVSVGPGAGTSWTPVASLAAVPTWAAVLGAGNTSGGTDAVMSDGDELRWEDGAAVTRRSDDLAAGEPRTRYFTAAAALAATLSVATATGLLTYTDDLALSSPNATETIGDGGGSPGLNATKAEAGEFSMGVFSAGVPRWAPIYVPSDETLRSLRYNAAGALVNTPIVFSNPTTTTTLNDTVIDIAASGVTVLHGSLGAGSPSDQWYKPDAGAITLQLYSAAVLRGQLSLPSDESVRLGHYTAAAALDAELQLSANAAAFDANTTLVTLAAGTFQFNLGAGTGSGLITREKSDAGSFVDGWRVAGTYRWAWTFDPAEDHYWQRLDAAGVSVNFPLVFFAAAQTTELRDTLIHATQPDVVVQVGDNTGTQPQVQLRAAAASSNYFTHYQNSVRMWDTGQTHNDANWYVDRFVGGVFSNTPIQIDSALVLTRLQDDTVWLRQQSVTLQFGDGLGSPNEQKYKADAGSYSDSYYNIVTLRWVQDFPSDETLRWQRFTAAGAFISFALTFNSVDLQANAQTTLADAAIVFAYPSVTGYWGDSTAAPTQIFRKADANQSVIFFYSAGVPRGALYQDSDESTRAGRYDAAGAFVNNPLVFNAAAVLASTVTTLGDAQVNFSYANVISHWGDFTGTPLRRMRKADATQAYDEWRNVGDIPRWRAWIFESDESLRSERVDAAGAHVNYPLVLNAAATVAAAITEFRDATFSFSYTSPNTQYGAGTGSPVWQRQKSDAGSATDTWVSNSITRGQFLMNSAEEMDWRILTAAGANDSNVRLFAGGIVAMDLPSTQLWVGDWNSTGSPSITSWKGEANTATENVVSAAVTRYTRLVDAAEDVYFRKITAASALETEIAMLATGFVRMQTHWGVTDAITAPAALAGYAKFYLDSAANGRPRLIEGDGSIEQLGIGVTSQAMPVADRETTDLVVANTVVETDIFSYSIPANTLGVTGVLHCELGGFIHCEVAATLQIRIYLGATTLYDSTTNTLSATTEDDAAFFILVDLGNQNATNDQAGDGFIMISNASNAATGVGALSSGAGGQASTPISLGDGAVDTTAAQTFRISVTWSAADANNRLVRRNAYATLAAAA